MNCAYVRVMPWSPGLIEFVLQWRRHSYIHHHLTCTNLADCPGRPGKSEVGFGRRGLGIRRIGECAKQQFQWPFAADTARTGGWDRSGGCGHVAAGWELCLFWLWQCQCASAIGSVQLTQQQWGWSSIRNSKSGFVGQWHSGDRFGGTTSVDSSHKRWAKRLWIFGRRPQWMVHRGCLCGVYCRWDAWDAWDAGLCRQPLVDLRRHPAERLCGPGLQQCGGHFFAAGAAELGETAKLDHPAIGSLELADADGWSRATGHGSQGR